MNTLQPKHLFVQEHALEAQKDLIASWGSRALIVTGKSSAVKSGALAELLAVLADADIEPIIFDRIGPNPTLFSVRDAAAFGLAKGADCVFGVGGGSAMDAAKVVAVLLANPALCDEDLFGAKWQNHSLPPLGLVGTTAGTGSEVTQYSVLTQPNGQKRSVSHADLFATAAFCDWRYTQSMGYDQTLCTALDALSHAMEGYFANHDAADIESDTIKATDRLMHWLTRLQESASIYQTPAFRREVYLASLQAGRVIAHNRTCFAHLAGYALTEQANVPHGMACAVFLPLFLEHAAPCFPQRVAALEAAGISLEKLTQTLWQSIGSYFADHPLDLDTLDLESQLPRYENASGLNNAPNPPTGEALLEGMIQTLELLATE